MSRNDQLRVTAAAIRVLDGTVYSPPPPARHHDVIAHMVNGHGVEPPVGHRDGDDQGFLLSDGRFAMRRPALYIARLREQLIREPTAPAHGLFSEDVW